jgi:hypothetical protein
MLESLGLDVGWYTEITTYIDAANRQTIYAVWGKQKAYAADDWREAMEAEAAATGQPGIAQRALPADACKPRPHRSPAPLPVFSSTRG